MCVHVCVKVCVKVCVLNTRSLLPREGEREQWQSIFLALTCECDSFMCVPLLGVSDASKASISMLDSMIAKLQVL